MSANIPTLVPTAPKASAAEKAAGPSKAANAFRGSIIGCYTRLEHAITILLANGQIEPAYSQLASKPPLMFGLKLKLLRTLAEVEGPWKVRLQAAIPHLDELARYDELRNLMAHGTVEIARGEINSSIYIFRMLTMGKGGLSQQTLALDHLQANALLQRLRTSIDGVIQSLDSVNRKAKPVLIPVAVKLPA